MLINFILWLVVIFCLCAGIYCLVIYRDNVPKVFQIVFWAIMVFLAVCVLLWTSVMIHNQLYPIGIDVRTPIVIYNVLW